MVKVEGRNRQNHSFFLVKSEPTVYSFEKLCEEKITVWDGVRNYAARNHLREMKKGDLVFFYHSNEGKEIVGLAKVVKTAYPDPTSDEDWSAVRLEALKPLKKKISLSEIKRHPDLSKMDIVSRSRLSVSKVAPEHAALILALCETSL